MTNEYSGFDNMKTSFKDEFCVWSSVGNFSAENDVNEEYILPDYFPDIRKILLVKANIQNSEITADSSKANISGELYFSVVYLSEDGEIKCIGQYYDYTNKIVDEAIYEDSVLNGRSFIKNRSVRALSPRKLLIKAKIGTDLSVYNKLCVSPRLVGSEGVEDEFTLERKMNEIDCVNFIKFSEGDIRVSEDIEYTGKMPIGEIISSDVELYNTDAKYSDSKLNIKGNAKFTCLFALNSEDEQKQYEMYEKIIPINKTCDLNLPTGEWKINCNLMLGAFECSVANDSYGEPRIFELDFSASANMIAMSNEKTYFTDDVFCTLYEYSNKYKTVNTQRVNMQDNVNFSVSGEGELPETDGQAESILMYEAIPQINSMENKAGKVIFNGETNVKLVVNTNENGYVNTEFTFPFKYEMQSTNNVSDKYMCDCYILDMKMRLDKNKINANAEIGLNLALFEDVSANAVESININKNNPIERQNEKVMFLYYPEENESLWSIAKKYYVSPKEIEKANNKNLSEILPRVIVIPA